MQHTRQQIIDYLRAHRQATSLDLSRALQVTAANIRHHLAILLEQGLVEVEGQATPRQRGHPTRVFRLTHQAMAHNFEALAGALLQTLLADRSAEEQQQQMSQVAAQLLPSTEPPRNKRRRLELAVETLNRFHYKARWEAAATGPQVILAHCPYLSLLPQHPELCQMDAALISQLTLSEVRQIARQKPDRQAFSYCLFTVKA